MYTKYSRLCTVHIITCSREHIKRQKSANTFKFVSTSLISQWHWSCPCIDFSLWICRWLYVGFVEIISCKWSLLQWKQCVFLRDVLITPQNPIKREQLMIRGSFTHSLSSPASLSFSPRVSSKSSSCCWVTRSRQLTCRIRTRALAS